MRKQWFSLLMLSGASVLAIGSPVFSQGDMEGVCFADAGPENEMCACVDDTGVFHPERQYGKDGARLCVNIGDNERARLTGEPEVTGSISPPDEVDPPGVVNPPGPPGPGPGPGPTEPPGAGPTEPPGGEPTEPPSAGRVQEDNGIGNGIDDAPGSSDIRNGDVADGADSGGPNPEGSFTDGTAANGRPAGETNNPNADKTGGNGSTNTAEADSPGNSENAPGQNN